MDDSLTFVIFGITSNLSQVKLIPALYDIIQKDLLPKNTQIIGIARAPQKKEWIKEYITDVLHKDKRHKRLDPLVLKKLVGLFDYINGDINDPDLYQRIKEGIKHNNILFYLATYPELYRSVFENLNKVKLNKLKDKNSWTRVMIEKPIGEDLGSAKKLNKTILKYFKEEQIFRLDHYLGKETIQNILTFRFGNGLFEPLLNYKYIDHIQITSAESFGVESRSSYYDKTGALKDVGQNHLLQMLSITLMDAPLEFTNEQITKQRLKLLKKLTPKPEDVVFGRYEGYKQTDTFFALKTFLKSDRYKNVPIYIRAGKNLAQSVTEVSIIFKTHPVRLFKNHNIGLSPNILIYRIQPNEGIVLKILTKKPGVKHDLEGEYMQFCYKDYSQLSDPYERLIADALDGNQTFFNDSKEVEAQWRFIDPLVSKKDKIYEYKIGSWGPKEADRLIKEDNREWLEPSMLFCRI